MNLTREDVEDILQCADVSASEGQGGISDELFDKFLAVFPDLRKPWWYRYEVPAPAPIETPMEHRFIEVATAIEKGDVLVWLGDVRVSRVSLKERKYYMADGSVMAYDSDSWEEIIKQCSKS